MDGVLNNAQFGQPGEVTTISKSGTNKLHGGVFWYHQNAAFNATPFGAASKPRLVGNDFGGSVGGPVTIPHLYHGRDRTFFFGTYEGFRLPQSTPNQYIVPSTLMKQGNFNYLPANSLKNPFVPGTFYANNTLPAINAASQKFLQFFPDPNHGDPTAFPNGVPNYYVNQAADQSSNQFDVRGDQYFGQKALVFARYTWKNYDIGLPEPLLVPNSQQTIQDRILVLSANYNFSTKLINEFRFGFTFDNTGQTNGFDGPGFADSTGLQGLTNLYYNGVPELDFKALSSLNADRLTSITKSRTIQYLDTVSWQVKSHTLKFGVDLRHVEAVTPLGFFGADNYGTFDFTSAQFTGQEFADFLIGTPNVTEYDQVKADNDGRSLYSNAFFQDEWHARQNLVVSYGVRYEYHPAYSDPSGNIGNFDPSLAKSGVWCIRTGERACFRRRLSAASTDARSALLPARRPPTVQAALPCSRTQLLAFRRDCDGFRRSALCLDSASPTGRSRTIVRWFAAGSGCMTSRSWGATSTRLRARCSRIQ